MGEKITLTWTDGHGRERRREIDPLFDIRDFKGCPGFAMLVVAVGSRNGLSVADMHRWLLAVGIGRSRSWIQRRRWLFSNPDAVNAPGTKPNRDGKDERAIAIMRDNPTLSARQLSYLLKQHGIRRGKDWVLKNRCS